MNLETLLREIAIKEPRWRFYYNPLLERWVGEYFNVSFAPAFVVEKTLTEVAIKLWLHYYDTKDLIPIEQNVLDSIRKDSTNGME